MRPRRESLLLEGDTKYQTSPPINVNATNSLTRKGVRAISPVRPRALKQLVLNKSHCSIPDVDPVRQRSPKTDHRGKEQRNPRVSIFAV